jgi:hypothetical protein
LIWIALLIRWGINVLALIVVDWMFDGVTIGRWWPLLLAAAILTIGNTIIKPILAILTLPLIIITFGLAAGRYQLSVPYIALGFGLFRLFDIVKPFPIRRLERLPGGLGVVPRGR